ncbi:hypothetical protein Q4S45_03740 [Massilia sp. R2A-15]|uniref:hypothetical protein n=1 Tax=Massilia sp. R2A-15 TaxID=3064278 RepID=UPI0027349942|nr:hypothetical protein [Massilia sp. R2A-15]WLI90247.1 hypothetical protein Q4S45_03740 [Massilia sp. R2A-15]
MRSLEHAKWDFVAGGGTTGMVCAPAVPTHIKSRDIDVSSSSQLCQLANGNSVTTTVDITVVHASIGITGLVKRMVGLDAGVDVIKTTTETKTCKPNLECETKKDTTITPTSSDTSDGSVFEGFADFGSDGWGDSAGWGDGGAWAGGESGGAGGGFGGGVGGGGDGLDEYNAEIC